MAFKFVQSRFFVFIASVFFILLATFLIREIHKKYQIRQEIDDLEQEIASLETENKEVRDLIDYLKTPEFGERQARSLLNLQKPGEFVVVLPGAENRTAPDDSASQDDQKSNLIKWWNYFFVN